MNCCCKKGDTNDLKIEADVGADPIWCKRCGCNLDIEDVPISDVLAEELSSLARNYGKWINWDKDTLLPNGLEMEDEFNQKGVTLVEKLKQEIEGNYKIKFIPSTSARFYAKKQNGFS
ncbi:hypothetical protein [Metabacillus litoralis]|uniref:Uncharacterized protein n=2 Tax=Metabacillus TaxID=2675233 RepID=A0A179SR28_9BACI|nr:hypothetical protein [Metabacillus litoralis]OAS82742.1 hypothetical protein A6K24_11510 [Metabacillus litoralis]QNF30183.1 hypothetical protein HUW50_23610 [Metabacillus sp. KUDC1714]